MIVSVSLTLLLCAADPRTQAIANARALVDDFQFDKAIAAVNEALKQPGLETSSLISLYELEAIARSSKGDAAGAKDAFSRLLVLDPAHPMPNELPPKSRTWFFGAKSVAQREALGFDAEVPVRLGEYIETLSVVLKRSSVLVSKNVRFTVAVDGAAPAMTLIPLSVESKVELKVHGKAVSWKAELLGSNDAVLRTVSREEEAPFLPPPPPLLVAPVVVAPAPAAGSLLRPMGIVVGAAGLVGAGVGIALAVQSADSRRQITGAAVDGNGVVTGLTQAQAQKLDATARSSALAANVLMIAGGAAAVGGVLMFVLAPHEAPTQVSVSVGPSSVFVSGRF
jgi:hypothetical protein